MVLLLGDNKMSFTKEQVIKTAAEKYGKPVCIDFIDDAMRCETLEEAVELIITDSYYWDSEGIENA
jgi:hypothetical protein